MPLLLFEASTWASSLSGGLINGLSSGHTAAQRYRETGFMHLRARAYDPSTGRFLQRDPVAGAGRVPTTLNRYAYVLNNPVNHVDPSGLWGFGFSLGASLAVEGIGGFTGSAGAGAFHDDSGRGTFGGYASGGFVASTKDEVGAYGAFASAGPGVWVTDADSAEDLDGPGGTLTFGGPALTASSQNRTLSSRAKETAPICTSCLG
jgi:RHS repeat-associated protein